jgi:hypothetical protein
MRQHAFLLLAAVSVTCSATAQQTHFIPKLSIVKTCDLENINKPFAHYSSTSPKKYMLKQVSPSYQLKPGLNFPTLQHQLGADMQYLKIEKRNQGWQDIFQGLMQGLSTKGKPTL